MVRGNFQAILSERTGGVTVGSADVGLCGLFAGMSV